MAISDIRKELKAIQEEIQAGHPDEASLHAGRALELLDDSRLLTTTEAKDLLGIGSVNTLKVLVRKAGLVYKLHGNRMMIPLSELEKLQNSPLVRRVHALDRLHASTADLGGMEGLSQEELQELEEFRPGFPPWNKHMLETAESTPSEDRTAKGL